MGVLMKSKSLGKWMVIATYLLMICSILLYDASTRIDFLYLNRFIVLMNIGIYIMAPFCVIIHGVNLVKSISLKHSIYLVLSVFPLSWFLLGEYYSIWIISLF